MLARAAGVDFDALHEVVGSGSSAMLDLKAGPMRDGDFEPLFKLEHMLKDVRHCLAEARALGLELTVAGAAESLYAAAEAEGLGGRDFAAVIRAVGQHHPHGGVAQLRAAAALDRAGTGELGSRRLDRVRQNGRGACETRGAGDRRRCRKPRTAAGRGRRASRLLWVGGGRKHRRLRLAALGPLQPGPPTTGRGTSHLGGKSHIWVLSLAPTGPRCGPAPRKVREESCTFRLAAVAGDHS